MIQFADGRFKLFCSFMLFIEKFSYEERYSFVNAEFLLEFLQLMTA